MEIKAKVIDVLPIERGVSKSGKEWTKATVIAEYGDEKYPKKVAIISMKDAEKFAELAVGAEVEFSVDIESREFNGRWYTSVTCWKWATDTPSAPVPPAADISASIQEDDGLPF